MHRLLGEMQETAAEIDPDLNIDEVIDLLDNDPGRSAPDHEAFADFVREIQAHAVDRLDGSAFDVPPPMCDVTVNLAPPGGALGRGMSPHPRTSTAPDPSGTPSVRGPGSRTGRRSPPPITRASPGITSRSGSQCCNERSCPASPTVRLVPGIRRGMGVVRRAAHGGARLLREPGVPARPPSQSAFQVDEGVVDIGAHLEKRIPDDALSMPARCGTTSSPWITGGSVDSPVTSPSRRCCDISDGPARPSPTR